MLISFPSFHRLHINLWIFSCRPGLCVFFFPGLRGPNSPIYMCNGCATTYTHRFHFIFILNRRIFMFSSLRQWEGLYWRCGGPYRLHIFIWRRLLGLVMRCNEFSGIILGLNDFSLFLCSSNELV